MLLVDYLLAFQYFRIFRWNSDHHCLLDVHNIEGKQRIMNPQLVTAFLLDLEDVLPIDMFQLAVHLLQRQTNAQWIVDDHKAREENELSQLADSQLSIAGSRISVPRLQLLLLNKLEAEQRRNSYLGCTAVEQRNDVYTETDRIVRSLLEVQLEPGEACKMQLSKLQHG